MHTCGGGIFSVWGLALDVESGDPNGRTALLRTERDAQTRTEELRYCVLNVMLSNVSVLNDSG